MYDPKLATEAQTQYCEKMSYPNFAPYMGRCFSCGRNIYQPIKRPSGHTSGITVEGASSHLIVGCPHCNRSYCD
ncbi:hypothetical protein RFF05_06565 [Bengtsoniella intestinalis]|uniref:hypothetical protein n=1 Tax=Bengtsoniella intestinalis TaxID=3073143 RepID=UPI00391F8EBB